MQSFVLQDWITVRASGTANFIQEAKGWTAFSSFSDIVFWLDIRRLQPPAGTGVTWWFQTSPTKDESLFQPMTSLAIGGVPTPSSVVCLPVLVAGAQVPLATWVRWIIQPNGTGGGAPWDATFRVMVSANRVARGLA